MNAPLEELKARFLSLYGETITREGADSLLQWLTESDFFIAPASTRFHGCHEGGLLQHSMNVYDCLKRNIEQAAISVLSVHNSHCVMTVCTASSIPSGG